MLHCKIARSLYGERPGVSNATIMSKQLAISAAFSVFAMAAFALFATVGDSQRLTGAEVAGNGTGAPIRIEAPADLQLPDLPAMPRLGG